MLRNYLIIAFRSFQRQKVFATINLLGLALGLVVALFILLWVQDEKSYDQFHREKDQIHQVMMNLSPSQGEILTWEGCPEPYGRVLQSEIPEIKGMTHFMPWGHTFSFEDHLFNESGYYATSSFFEVFTFPLLVGNSRTALEQPNTLVISEQLAEKYFGNNWQDKVMGKSIRLDGEAEMQVSGVFVSLPENSSLQFDFVLPIAALHKKHPEWQNNWGNYWYNTYLKLDENADRKLVGDKLHDVIKRNSPDNYPEGLFLHPLTKKYLYSKFENGKAAGGRIDYVRIFFGAAIFILLIACINYMNLATARSSKRAREVGVRKVVGAGQTSLIGQFLTESVFTVFLAAALALSISQIFLGSFNSLTGKTLSIDLTSISFWGQFVGIVFIVGLLAGTYPALMLSSFKIINVLKGKISGQFSGINLRRGLVVLQFSLSILLILGAIVIQSQVRFIKNKNLGLDKNNVLSFAIDPALLDKFEVHKEKLLQLPEIAGITLVSDNPLKVVAGITSPNWEGMQENQRTLFKVLSTDHAFVSTMKIPLVAGRDFIEYTAVDSANISYIINEEMARIMGFEDPLNKQLEFWDHKGRIVGVVKNFHFASLHTAIRPLIIRYEVGDVNRVLLRPEPGMTEAALVSLKAMYKELAPDTPFDYEFLDEHYEMMYRGEVTTGKLADLFAIIAMIISCLGLLGLAAFTAEQRTKEIGIRKVLGASVGHILLLLNHDFARLILLAFIIAVPIAWYVLDKWLERFAYHVTIGWKAIAFSGGIILLAAILVVSFHSIRTATSNPVDSLRYE